MARQHVTLVPEREGEGTSIVAGWVDPATRRAELRSYGALSEAYFKRFGLDLKIPEGAYQRFLQEAEVFFNENDFYVQITEHAALPQAGPPEEREGRRFYQSYVFWIVLLIFTLGVGVGLGLAAVMITAP